MTDRQLWWNYTAITEEEKLNWIFVMINDKRECNIISDRILGKLAMIEDVVEKDGHVNKQNYKLLVFKSEKTLESDDLSSIYGGKKKRDARLYVRKKDGIEGLENYVRGKITDLR